MSESQPPRPRSGRNAALIGAGITVSRLMGFVRERVFAHYFGNSDALDAFRTALKVPNLLQNLFGDQAISASFIPVYTQLWERDRDPEEARRVAWTVGSLLATAMAVLVALGVLATPLLMDLIAPGFEGGKRDLAIRLVRVVFPGIGLLVLAAWCLGVLNSHRRMLLPYMAPVLWNLAMIVTLVGFADGRDQGRLAHLLAWGAVAGCALQFGVQLPGVVRLLGGLRIRVSLASRHVHTVARNFLPALGGRGVNQVAAYVDHVIASFLGSGAVSALGFVQDFYMLPVSVFGMANANAELPEMASEVGEGEGAAERARARLVAGLRRVAAFVIPSVVAFVALGDSIVALVFQTGAFRRADVVWVWTVLAAASVGLLAVTMGRMYASAFWARHDTRTPLRCAIVRVALGAGLGWLLALQAPPRLGLERGLGLAGLALASALAGWVELGLLRRALARHLGRVVLPLGFALRAWGAAAGAAAPAFGLKLALRSLHPAASGALVCGAFALGYLALAAALGIAEATAPLATLSRRAFPSRSLRRR